MINERKKNIIMCYFIIDQKEFKKLFRFIKNFNKNLFEEIDRVESVEVKRFQVLFVEVM